MKHKIQATVLQVIVKAASGTQSTTNIPVFPWDNLKKMKSLVRQATKEAKLSIVSMRKTKAMVQNPLIEN